MSHIISVDIAKTEEMIRLVVERCGANVINVGASEKSDAIYINIQIPKISDPDYGVLETWTALVRIANHYNHTNTEDLLLADFYANICHVDDIPNVVEELRTFLLNATCTTEE